MMKIGDIENMSLFSFNSDFNQNDKIPKWKKQTQKYKFKLLASKIVNWHQKNKKKIIKNKDLQMQYTISKYQDLCMKSSADKIAVSILTLSPFSTSLSQIGPAGQQEGRFEEYCGERNALT